MNSLFLQALQGQNRTGKVPVWLMRQAGRYMPSYRAVREKYGFVEMCKTPELVHQVTHLPIDTFGFDAAIVFSDILFIVETFGFNLRFEEGKGPIVTPTIDTPEQVRALHAADVKETLKFVFEGIRLLKKTLSVPLIGFAGAPFTVASYMIEGGSNRELRKTKAFMLNHPEEFHLLLDMIADATIEYLQGQVEAGVDALQLFDSWAGVLAWNQFEAFSYRYLKKICDGVKNCPIILFSKGSAFFYEKLAEIGPQAIQLDCQCDLLAVRNRLPEITLQGNLDPDIMLGSEAVVRREARAIMEKMKGDPAFIFNLGHGILPGTPEKNVYALLEAVRQ